jgi:hypothetical protein
MCGAIPPLLQNAFMAWCLVKKSTGTTFLYLSLPPPQPPLCSDDSTDTLTDLYGKVNAKKV